MIRHLVRLSLLGIALGVIGLMRPAIVHSQTTTPPAVTAEAIDHANLRAVPSVSADIVGIITHGTSYAVIGRSSHYPWLLLSVNDGEGWVFKDLVTIAGNLNSVPFVNDETPVGSITPPTATVAVFLSPTPTLTQLPSAAITLDATPSATLTLTPGMTATVPAAAYVTAENPVNVRYGPGTNFPAVGTLTPNQAYAVTRRHSLYPWLEIVFPEVAGGHGWVYKDAVKVTGSLQSVPTTNSVDFGYPTLTPTLQMVVVAPPPWASAPAVTDPNLQQLGTQIFDYLLKADFAPGTDRQASAFLMDLRTGQAVSLNPGVAYSGMSLIKIPILLAVYRALDGLPTPDEAQALGEMMICSSNENTNAILSLIGNGDVLAGVQNVTDTLHRLGLQNTFLTAPLMTDPNATPVPARSLKTSADQVSADPDPFNQATPADLGDVLTAVYQCAKDGSGPLIALFGNQFTINKCRAMVLLMDSDKIGVMVEAGVPQGTTVAHKHGWVSETHGDAAIVFTPGGDFVLTVTMRQKTWLDYTDSFPKISEIARMVYNSYNPSAPLAQIHPQTVPETCTLDPALLSALQSPDTLPMP